LTKDGVLVGATPVPLGAPEMVEDGAEDTAYEETAALEEVAGAEAVVEVSVVEVSVVVAAALEEVVAAAEVVTPGAEMVMVTPASAQNFSRSAGRAAKSDAEQAVSAHGVTMGVRVAEALHTQAKSVVWHPVAGTADNKQLKEQLGRSDKFWA